MDAGPPKSIDIFIQALQGLAIDPESIELILLTHGHWDHWGSLQEIKNLTSAPGAINHREKDWVENAEVHLPPGIGRWGNFLGKLMKLAPIKSQIEKTDIEIELNDEDFLLDKYGIKGRCIHTPGHTDGSMSVLLESGEAFVGDLAMSGFPRIGGAGPFVFGESIKAMRKSWQKLLDAGAVTIYPSHGKPFSANVFRKYL